ncbi:Sporozoite surface protein P36 [Frankliniella fusca]|uniref:Sporozoite surface protein P36 n=1 Tax=Frankliniella fusca TaxID=407009 RepID=A0AAE1HGH5_9NEOP|nr:Sporozoite surface protein P36 [Frankliniella fusca]
MVNNILMNPVAYPHWRVEDGQVFKKIFTGTSPEATWVRLVPQEKRKEVLEECRCSSFRPFWILQDI